MTNPWEEWFEPTLDDYETDTKETMPVFLVAVTPLGAQMVLVALFMLAVRAIAKR